jgi:hypothetical protein
MSSDLRSRLHAATPMARPPVSIGAIQAEVTRRRRNRRRWGAAGVVVLAATLASSLPFAIGGSPAGTARLNGTPPPQPSTTRQPSPTSGLSGTPTLRLSWSGQPRDGAATVTGTGFPPGANVQIVPCSPNADCANQPAASVRADRAGTFSVSVTEPLVIHDGYGDSFICAQNCKFVAGNAAVSAQTAPFDLALLPPAREQCSTRALQLVYVGPGSSTSGTQAAVFRVRNTGTSPCWVFGPGAVGLDNQPPMPKVGWTVDQSAPAWPPKVITLQAGDTAQFTVTKPVCTGTSVPLTEILFGDIKHNGNVPLPSGAQAQLALCSDIAGATANSPAPENVLSVTAYTAG